MESIRKYVCIFNDEEMENGIFDDSLSAYKRLEGYIKWYMRAYRTTSFTASIEVRDFYDVDDDGAIVDFSDFVVNHVSNYLCVGYCHISGSSFVSGFVYDFVV